MANYNFTVSPTVNNGTVTWELCFVGPPVGNNQPGCGPAADVKIPINTPAQSFTYTINDNTGLGFVFAPDRPPNTNDGPIWIDFGQKPAQFVVNPEIVGLTPGGQKNLHFTDRNDNAGILKYQLNFVDKDGNKSALDPEITNGGKGFVGVDYAALLIGGAVLAALVAALVSYFVARATVHSLIPKPPNPDA